MADASELFRKGKLSEAVEAQLAVVRSKPADQPSRLFLFELLSFAGDLERASRQVDALTLDDPDLHLAAGNYRNCLKSEEARRKVLEGGKPRFFMDPGPATLARLEAFAALAAGDHTAFQAKLGEANSTDPVLKGTLNGKPFELIRDADDLFAGVLEVFAQGNYYWIPLDQVASMATNAPKSPRDLLWMPANLAMVDGATGPVFLPALYLGSHSHGLETVKLGRERDWMPVAPEASSFLRGFGPRVFLVGEDESNLTDIRELTITT
jgi:type VI secretion system protein ImpE